LNREDREAWERAKKRGGHGFGDGTGGGGVLEIRTTATSALAPHGHPLVNTHRLYCDAKKAAFVAIEKENRGRDDVVVDLSTLRVNVDGRVRARLVEIAKTQFAENITNMTDLCEDLGEPLEAQVRYIQNLETKITLETAAAAAADASAQPLASPGKTPASISDLRAVQSEVESTAERVRSMKDAGAANADANVREAVAKLLALKNEARELSAALAAATPEAQKEAEAKAEADVKRWTAEAKRTIQELPIHNLPERYLRFRCADRPTAKALAKAVANEKVYALVDDDDDDEDDDAEEEEEETPSTQIRSAVLFV
jgi:hypothetical protein